MKLKEHIALINNANLIHLRSGTETLYKGYKGNVVHMEDVEEVTEREVVAFSVIPEISKRNAPDNILPITELNCGQYNYGDLRVRLFYTYSLSKEKVR